MFPNSQLGAHGRGRRRTRSALASAALLAALLPGLSLAGATSALANTGPDDGMVPQQISLPPSPAPDQSSLPLPDQSGLTGTQQVAMRAAAVQAARTGKAVVVGALTTETSTTEVLPGGRTRYTSSVLPVRVRRGNGWTPVDTTMTHLASGGYAPAASPSQLVFSDGGSRPLVVMSDGGASLALSWPTALPKPTVSGSTLTYASVLPSVDLKVTATRVGGFTETLVVKSASAASNPALANLTLGTETHGLAVRADAHGNLDAIAPNGRIVFHAPQPQMWDSSVSTRLTRIHPAATAADLAAQTSTETTAGAGANTAVVGVHLARNAIHLVPSKRLLSSHSVHYPMFIDPPWTATGKEQHFVTVQEGCPGAQNEDSTTYGSPGVGDNSFSGCIGRERAYYQLGIPTQIYGAQIDTTQTVLNLEENYSASCSATDNVNLYWSSMINSSTDWNNQDASPVYEGNMSYGPACGKLPSQGFKIGSLISQAAKNRWSNVTFGVFNSNESDSTYFKRFATNPSLTIYYDHPPATPTQMTATATGYNLGCATTTPYPELGRIDNTSYVSLNSYASDPDGDSTQTTYQWWVDGSSTKTSVSSAYSQANNSTASASQAISGSYLNGLANGTVIDWQPTSITDHDLPTSGPSTVCHFAVYPTAETIQLSTPNPAAENTPVSVTATSNSSDPAVKYVYSLDVKPPTTNAPAWETLSGSQVSNGTATITTVPLGAGTHTLYVNGYDKAGNVFSDNVPITVQAAAGQTYSSLSAAYDNTAVSGSVNTSTTGADMDGLGNSLSLQDLQAAGWNPTTHQITVDGATIQLPTYGNGAHDNVLADNQTINFPASTQGDALVILATAANAEYAPTDGVSPSSITAPRTPVGTAVAGFNCSNNQFTQQSCHGATGTLNYADSTTANYDLGVPDWAGGAGSGLQVLTLPHYTNRSTANISGNRYLYAFAIHLTPGAHLSSITLPDISGPLVTGATQPVDPTNISGNPLGSPVQGVAALHILGMGVRHATTDTNSTTWTGAWAAAPENQFAWATSGNTHVVNQTYRTALTPSVSGSGVRLRLSNELSSTPLVINQVTVANQSTATDAATTTATGGPTITTPGFSPIPAATPIKATFQGQTSVTIPAGGDLYSDLVPGITVTAGKPLLVSFALGDNPTIEGHLKATDAYTWNTPQNSGDQSLDTTGAPFLATGAHVADAVNILSGLDTVTTGNQPTVAVLGDGLYNPYGTGATGVSTTRGPRLSDALIADLASQTALPRDGVVNVGIENNSLINSTGGDGGMSAQARIDQAILSEPGLQTVVVDQGLVDTLNSTLTQDQVQTALQNLQMQFQAWGLKTVYTTMTPCGGHAACTTSADAERVSINTEMIKNWPSSTAGQMDYKATEDASGAVANTASPQALSSDSGGSFDSGDHINLTPYANATIGAPAHFTLADLSAPSLIPNPTQSLSLQYHWGLTDGSGTNANEDVNGATLPLNNTTWSTDSTLPTADTTQSNPQGTDLLFDGATSNGTIQGTVVATQSKYSVDAWVKLSSLTSTDQTVVNETDGSANAFTLGYNGTTQAWTVTALTNDTTPVAKTITGPAATAGTWTHLSAVYDSTGTLTLYVNGVSAGSVTNASPLYDQTGGSNTTFSIGAIVPTNSTTASSVLHGALSDITIRD